MATAAATVRPAEPNGPTSKLRARALALANQRKQMAPSQAFTQPVKVTTRHQNLAASTKGAWDGGPTSSTERKIPSFKTLSSRMKPSKEEVSKWQTASKDATAQRSRKPPHTERDDHSEELQAAQLQAVKRERERRVRKALVASKLITSIPGTASTKQSSKNKTSVAKSEPNLEEFKKLAVAKEKELERKRNKRAALQDKSARSQAERQAAKTRAKQLDVQLWRDEAINREKQKDGGAFKQQKQNSNRKANKNAKAVMEFMIDCMRTLAESYDMPQVPLDVLEHTLHDAVDGHNLPLLRADWAKHVPVYKVGSDTNTLNNPDEVLVDCEEFIRWVQSGACLKGNVQIGNDEGPDISVPNEYLNWLAIPAKGQVEEPIAHGGGKQTQMPKVKSSEQQHMWQKSNKQQHHHKQQLRAADQATAVSFAKRAATRLRRVDMPESHYGSELVEPSTPKSLFDSNENQIAAGNRLKPNTELVTFSNVPSIGQSPLEQRLGYLSTELEKILSSAKESELRVGRSLEPTKLSSRGSDQNAKIGDKAAAGRATATENQIAFPVVLYSGRCWLACQQRGAAWKAGVRNAREWEDYPDVCAEVRVEGRPHCVYVQVVIIKLGVEAVCEITREDLEDMKEQVWS
jgi:hypothetical protein